MLVLLEPDVLSSRKPLLSGLLVSRGEGELAI